MNDQTTWLCPHCDAKNTETPETVMAECERCGGAYDMPPNSTVPDGVVATAKTADGGCNS